MAAKHRKKGTRRSSFNKRRKGLLAVVIPWMRRFGMVLAVCTAIVWASSWLYLSGALARAGNWTEAKLWQVTADMGFTVENIMVEGRTHTDTAVLLAIVNIEKGDPLFSFNPKEAQELITRIGWVESAQVQRRWPDTIYIRIKERTPLALWQTDKRVKLLDSRGEIIPAGRLERFADLVMVVGQEAPEHAAALIGDLAAETAIYECVEIARWIGDRRWDLRLKNAIEVKLPENDIGLALRRLSKAQEEDGLLDKDIIAIDMREPDRISVQTKPGKLSEYKTGLKIDAAVKSKAGNNI
ncbi:MAG: FtsQ-type POTRA domain-containing protein [Alphaproteobacteria bacterium]